MLCFLLSQKVVFSLFSSFVWPRMALGGCLALFCFLLVSLASFSNIALIANQILSLWYGKNHVPTTVFLSCLAKSQKCWLKKSSLSFISPFGQPRGMIKDMCNIYLIFPRLQVHMYIYIHIYIYTSIFIT